LHNLGTILATTQSFTLNSPIEIKVPLGSDLDPTKFFIDTVITNDGHYIWYFDFIATYTGVTPLTSNVTISFTGLGFINQAICSGQIQYTLLEFPKSLTIPAGSSVSTTYRYTYDSSSPSAPYGGPFDAAETQGPCYNEYGELINNPSDPTYTGDAATYDIIIIGQNQNTGSYTTYLTTHVTSSYSYLYYNTASQQVVLNPAISQYYNLSPVMDSTQDPSWKTSGLEKVVLPININVGDKLACYNPTSLGWDERFEYTVKNVSFYNGIQPNIIVTGKLSWMKASK
jgi:hypothetical protein